MSAPSGDPRPDEIEEDESEEAQRARLERQEAIQSRLTALSNLDVDLPEEEVQTSRHKAKASLEEITDQIRQNRANNWAEKVPPRWKNWTIDQLPPQFQKVGNEWISSGFTEAKNLILFGRTGSGKTSMAYALGRELYLLGYKVKVYHTAEMFDEMRRVENSEEVMKRVKEADLLILDDLGSERRTEWVEERLFLIIDYRWQWELPSIITTNYTPAEFSSNLSKRVVSRLFDNTVQVPIEGKDYRAPTSKR